MKNPNIVFVMADDVTPHYHGCYGGPTPTPNIDRLAAEGALFENSHSVAPLCNPSRYGIFTGQYCGRAGTVSKDSGPGHPYSVAQNAECGPETPTLAKVLKGQGYFTGHVGKWHSNFSMLKDSEWPGDLGKEVDPDDPAVDQKIRELQELHQTVVKKCAGFEWVGAVNWGNLMGNRPEPLQHHNPAWKTGAALAFLEEAFADERPFYLHLANTVPHGPDPNLSLGKDHRYTFSGKLKEAPSSHPEDETVLQRLRDAGLQTGGPIAGINAGVIQIDDQIGVLMGRLEEAGQLDNTLFLYTADHGIHGKGTPYLSGFHMPLVIRWPEGFEGGQRITGPVSHVDFFPALLEAAGIPLPGEHRLDGFSFLPRLKKEPFTERTYTYQEMGVARAVTCGRYRYILFHYPDEIIEKMKSGALQEPPSFQAYEEGPFGDYNFINKPHYFDPEQFYDLAADPFERNNLCDHPAYSEVKAEVRACLLEVLDTLPGKYRTEPHPFQKSPAYRRRVEKRRLRVQQSSFYPQGFDQEKIFNLNLPDPLAPPPL